MKRRIQKLAALAFLWATVVVILYYVRHKPVTVQSAEAIGRIALDTLWAAGILMAAVGLGRKTAKLPQMAGFARLTVQAGLGFGALSLLWLGLSALGLISSLMAVGLFASILILLRREIRAAVLDLRRAAQDVLPVGRFETAVALLTAGLAAAGMFEALASPVGFDALVYHLELPRDFLRAGRLMFTPENPFWGQPLGVEMLYLWAMSLGRAQTAALLGWGAGVLVVLATVQVASRLGSGAGWLAGAALLGGESLYQTLGAAYVDWWSALYGLAAFVLLSRWDQDGKRADLLLAGVLTGFAIGAKYTGGVILFGGFVLLALRGRERLGSRWLAFGGAALLAVSPWLVKNVIATGSPLYPFFGAADPLDAVRQGYYQQGPSSYAWLTALLIPVTSTILGVEGAPGFAASIGPLLAAFTPGALLAAVREERMVRRAWVFFVVAWVIWGAGSLYSVLLSQPRLYLAVFPIWAVLAAAGFAGLRSITLGQVRLGRLANALVLIVLVLMVLQALVYTASEGSVSELVGAQSKEAYLTNRLGGYYVAARMSEELGGSSDVLALWEARGFYCPNACVPDPWLDRWRIDLHRHGSPEAIRRAWAEQGLNYVLLHTEGVRFLQANDPSYLREEWSALERILEGLELVAQVGDGYEIYRIPAP